MPLTPSFVGSNPATPATDTIYCIRLNISNTIYGFCFMWLLSLFPKLGKEMGKLFGLNFVFCFVFQPVLPAYAGFFVLFLLFQKIGLGKLLSVNYLFGFFELKFLRIVRVHRRGYRASQTMPRPDAHDLAGTPHSLQRLINVCRSSCGWWLGSSRFMRVEMVLRLVFFAFSKSI